MNYMEATKVFAVRAMDKRHSLLAKCGTIQEAEAVALGRRTNTQSIITKHDQFYELVTAR